MKIPKYIDKLLERRTRLAIQLDKTCMELDEWLDKNDIEPDCSCYRGGVETYINPHISEQEVRETINKTFKERGNT